MITVYKTVSWPGGPAVTLNYRYDALGSLTNLWSSTAKGVTNVYQYDLLGRLSTVLASNTLAASYGYDGVGNLQTLRYANGVASLYQYDARNRLTNLVWQAGSTALASYAYAVGPTGNRLSATENGGARVYNWAYDYLYRMTGETFTGTGFGFTGSPSVTYGFDAAGNRTSRTSSVSTISSQTATYTANDWLASDKYDSNGNTTNSGTVGYQYDVLGHLTNVNSGQILITYDGDGNRVSKKVNGVTTYYLVDDRNPSGYAQVLEEYQGTSLTRVYNYGLALISQQLYDPSSHLLTSSSYYGTDGHGSTRFLLNASGDTYSYDAYGLLIPSASGGSTPNNYLYCGQQWDGDLGMYYLRARYYKPDTGRFWTMDTYEGNNEDPLSLHKYLYCQNDPINGVDPSGHDDIGGMLGAMDISFMFAQIVSPVTTRAVGVAQRVLGVGRPSSKDFWAAYPDYDIMPPAYNSMVWDLVGGSLGATFGPKGNSCATRVSYALNYMGGSDIKQGAGYRAQRNRSSVSYHGRSGDDKFYITGAGDMKDYLFGKWGKQDAKIWSVSKLNSFIAGLGAGQIAVFATPGADGYGHSGVLKKGYEDPYVEGELPVWVWALSTP